MPHLTKRRTDGRERPKEAEAELKFMADLRTIIKETGRDRELIATMLALEKMTKQSHQKRIADNTSN